MTVAASPNPREVRGIRQIIRLAQRDSSQHLPRGRRLHFEHALALLAEEAGEAGVVGAGAPERPRRGLDAICA
jgi:hypothetical protein